MKQLPLVKLSGKEVLPIIEGGKGVGVTVGATSGAFARENAVGTVSGVFNNMVDENGNNIPYVFNGKNAFERQKELIKQSIKGGLDQIKIAYEKASGNGRVHLNVLWEQGGAFETIDEILQKAKGMVHGVTCGAGMPYKLAELASKYSTFYYPIVSSARAFKALWARGYKNYAEFLGGIVYEDPWLAGGHNGLSNKEDPEVREKPFERVAEIRKTMREVGVSEETPIILGGGVWNLSEWQDYIGTKEIGAIAFQIGTRPLLTKESPVAKLWGEVLVKLKEADIALQKFSPTGFYSSAVRNNFLTELFERKATEIAYSETETEEHKEKISLSKVKEVFVTLADKIKANEYIAKGLDCLMRTPDNTIIFVTKETEKKIKELRSKCVGCLSNCLFSGWSQHTESHTTGLLPDPRLFCIYKTLTDGISSLVSNQDYLMFSGHLGYRFATDEMYKNGNIPTIKELVEALVKGK